MATYEENVQWMQTLSPEKRSLIQNIANLGVMRSNARNTSSRLGQQRSEISFKQAGGEAAYQNLISQLKTDPQLYQEWKGRAQRTGGIGQGMTELSMLAAAAAAPYVFGSAGAGAGAGASSGAGAGGFTAAGVTPEVAAFGLGEAIPTAGGFLSAADVAALGGGAIGAAGAGISGLGSNGLSSLAEIAGNIPSGLSNLLTNPNTIGNIASGLAGLYGSKVASDSASRTEAIQAQATQNALDETKRQFDIGRSDQMPWMTGGQTALNEQLNLMGLGKKGAAGSLAALTSSPGYQFGLDQGLRAREMSAAAKGGLFSGAAGKALTRYGQDYATGEYGNRLAQLSSLSGQGQSAASGMASQGTNYAGNVSNLLTGGANAQGAAEIARGAANQSGILGVGQSISNIFNPPKAQPTLADLLKSREAPAMAGNYYFGG